MQDFKNSTVNGLLLVELLQSEVLRSGSLVDAMQELSRTLCAATGVDRVSVAVRDAEQDELVFAEAYVAAENAHTAPYLATGAEPLTVFKFAEAGSPVVADDVETHPALARFAELIFRPVDIRAMVQVPIDVDGRMVGVFNMSVCGRTWSWRDDQVQTGKAIAALAALVIQRHGRRHVVEERGAADNRLAQQQVALQRLLRENTINSTSLEQELRSLSETAAAMLGIERFSVWRFAADNSALVSLNVYDTRDGSHASGVAISRKEHPAYFDAVLTAGLLVVDDIKTDPRTQSFQSGYVPVTGVTALLDMAIVAAQGPIGVVCVETCRPHMAWSEEQKLFVASLTGLAALAMERHERQRAEAGIRESSRRLSSHFTAIDAIMQSETFHRGSFDDAMRHLSRALCHEIHADRTAVRIIKGEYDRYTEVYNADRDKHIADAPIGDGSATDIADAASERLVSRPDCTTLHAPVRFHGEIVGEVRAWTANTSSAWSSGELLMLSIVAQLATLVLERQHRLRIERNLRHANRAAEEASRAKTQFLANMSHEIRTPMNGVFGMTDLLLQTSLSDRQKQIVGTIQQSTAALLAIIHDILDISRIESGRVELEAKPFQLKPCIEGAVALFVEEARRKGIRLNVDISAIATDWVLGDATRLRQICVNLLGNALKFTMKGTVALSVTRDTETGQRGRLCFAISDTGIGIEPTVQQRLFRPFSQADGSITRRFGGTGLGLSISRSLIEMMDGSISIDSRPDQGTVVAFNISLQPAAAPSVPGDTVATLSAWLSSSASIPVAKSHKRFSGNVLVAEDNPVNQEVTRELVGALGCTVTCVENGEEAIRAYEAQAFDLVLMDCQMPRLDGLSATRQIRAIEAKKRGPRVPIVAVTANAFTEDRDACLDAGMDGYLSKPFTSEQLDGILQRWLPAHLAVERRRQGRRPVATSGNVLVDLDPVVLEPMKRLRVEFYRRLLGTYLQHSPPLVDSITEAIRQREFAAIRIAAHSLKSSSANVGAVRLSALTRDAEVAATRNEESDIDRLATDITAAFQCVKALFEAELRDTTVAPAVVKSA